MKTVSLSLNQTVPILPPLLHADSQLNRTAVKTQSMWNQFLNWMGQFIRDAFFLPLPHNPSLAIKNFLKKEEDFVAAFWDASKPLDLNYPHQIKIREQFSLYNQPIKMQMADGKFLEITCRIIESKEKSEEKFYNFIDVLGNISTISNNVTSLYPFLAAYLDHKEKDPALPPARFILISQNDIKVEGAPFKPRSLDEGGMILKQTLEMLNEKYGQIDHLLSESLGSIVFASSLKYFEPSAKSFPQHIHIDRAPSSIEASSRNYYFGSILHFLAKISGWSVDVGQELVNFYQRNQQVSCIVSGMKDDFYFPGLAGLHEHQKIKALRQVKVLVFHPPRQLFHVRAHHALRADFLNGNYLVGHSDRHLLRRGENLAQASLRRSFQIMKGSQSLSA